MTHRESEREEKHVQLQRDRKEYGLPTSAKSQGNSLDNKKNHVKDSNMLRKDDMTHQVTRFEKITGIS